jgi:hypothetical protein
MGVLYRGDYVAYGPHVIAFRLQRTSRRPPAVSIIGERMQGLLTGIGPSLASL